MNHFPAAMTSTPISNPESRPRIALTMGDIAGIGPEVIVRACADPSILGYADPLVVGHPEILRRAIQLLGIPLDVREVQSPRASSKSDPAYDGRTLSCWNPGSDDVLSVPAGRNDPRSGRAAYDYLIAAIRSAVAGEIDGITTAPLSKAALHLGGINSPGHTEILAAECGVEHYGMMLYLPRGEKVRGTYGLGVVHVTLHTSIRSVPGLLTLGGIREKILLIAAFMREMGSPSPRIAVTALNPHAGEGGLFGDEEARIIAPAVEAACGMGVDVQGPYPADTLLKRSVAGEFDAVVAMYHDQGHIALKLIAFESAVNVTLGLPIVRTSPSHGTAFDIAWQGKASGAGMLHAIRVAAARISARRC